MYNIKNINKWLLLAIEHHTPIFPAADPQSSGFFFLLQFLKQILLFNFPNSNRE